MKLCKFCTWPYNPADPDYLRWRVEDDGFCSDSCEENQRYSEDAEIDKPASHPLTLEKKL